MSCSPHWLEATCQTRSITRTRSKDSPRTAKWTGSGRRTLIPPGTRRSRGSSIRANRAPTRTSISGSRSRRASGRRSRCPKSEPENIGGRQTAALKSCSHAWQNRPQSWPGGSLILLTPGHNDLRAPDLHDRKQRTLRVLQNREPSPTWNVGRRNHDLPAVHGRPRGPLVTRRDLKINHPVCRHMRHWRAFEREDARDHVLTLSREVIGHGGRPSLLEAPAEERSVK